MKKTKEINILGKTTYKELFDNSIRCGEFYEEGCQSYNWNVEKKEGTIFTLKCNTCFKETKIEILSHNKYIKQIK